MDINWKFPSNNHGQRQGISNAALIGFKSGPVKSLAREICQNSLDASIENTPVRIEFDMFEINTDEFPGIVYFKDAIESSIETWKDEKNQKTVTALNRMKEYVNRDKMTFLRISDFNTTGLRGSDKYIGTEWHNLVKATGSSAKSGTTGGSFGIGKNATFVCSEIRTVFYSTKDIDGHEATQGVAQLVSFNLNDEDDPILESQGTGYYGNPTQLMPISSCVSLQPGYNREVSGTDIYIAAYKDEFKYAWEKVILKEVIDNYFYAIHKGTLEIKISDIVVNSSTLGNIIKTFQESLTPNSVEYYKVLTCTDTIWDVIDFEGYGNIRSGFLIGETNLIKRVAMIRKPWMKIKEDKLSEIIPFCGVLIVEGEELNEQLRRLEDPTHSKWDPSLLESDIEKIAAKNLLKKLKDYLINQLKDNAINFGSEEIALESANDFIPFEEDEEESKNQSDVENLQPGIKEIEVKKVKKIITKSKGTTQEEAELLESSQGIPNDDTNGRNRNGDKIKNKDKGMNDPEVENDGSINGLSRKEVNTQFTKFFSNDSTKKHYTILFQPDYSASDCSIVIYKLDEQNERSQVSIVKAEINNTSLNVKKNQIIGFNIKKDEIISINFETESSEYFSAEVIIYGNQQ